MGVGDRFRAQTNRTGLASVLFTSTKMGVSRQVEDQRAEFPVSAHHQLGPCPLCSYLKHDLAWSMFCSAMFEGFACAGERQHFGNHRL